MSAKGAPEKWRRPEERAWLCTLNAEQLDGYLTALPARRVDFEGQPATLEFLADCRRDVGRAREVAVLRAQARREAMI